jgi:aryl-alcohol dehydrogenase-like predicted oxidoreductase
MNGARFVHDVPRPHPESRLMHQPADRSGFAADDRPARVAVAWTLSNPAVDGAIVGFRRPDQVDPIIGAANLELGEDDLAAIEGRS